MEKLLHNETELLNRLSQGDQQAYRTIFEGFVGALHYFARQLLHDPAAAEDVVSFAFHQMWERRNQFSNLRALRSFLYTAVRRQCIDQLRHQKVVNRAHKDLLATQLQNDQYVETRFLQAEIIRLVYAEINTLPERYRSILEWTFIDELSTADISEKLGSSEGHVRADRSRALALLRAALRKKGLLEAAVGLYFLLTNEVP